MIVAIVGNTGATSTDNIEEQIFYMNCPSPIFDGVATLTDINDYGVTYTVVYGNGTSNTGTFFECSIDGAGLRSANTIIKEYGATFFDTIPYGWLGFVADYISSGLQHAQAFFTIIAFMITPINFSILGYSLADISGIGAMIVIGVYVFCYVGIGNYIIPMIIGMVRSRF